jgi:putative two-component system response regulator
MEKLETKMNNRQSTILVVDDEQNVRTLLKQILSNNGYHCREAANADEALVQLRDDSVGLVLLDINMPGRSGADLLPEIRADHPDTAVIMATAVSDTTIAINCMKHGAYDYITKPFEIDEVIICIERALEKTRLEIENRDYQQHLEQKVTAQAEKIRASFINTMTSFAYALEAKDKYTAGHSQRVAQMSEAIAREFALPLEDIDKVKLAGQLHDIGKIGVRESVLNKPGRLTDDEFEHIQCHPEIGERILAPVVDDMEILAIVRHHHERYDGSGYPDGIAKEEIPLGARILAVADTFDAMTSDRPYRKAMSIEFAANEIERNAGKQFDSEVVDGFLRTMKLAGLADIRSDAATLAAAVYYS